MSDLIELLASVDHFSLEQMVMAWLDVIKECRSYRGFVASNLNNSNNRQISIKRLP